MSTYNAMIVRRVSRCHWYGQHSVGLL